MMTAKSIDFITGYVFSKIDRSIFKHTTAKGFNTFEDSQVVPKIWFGLKCTSNHTNDITGDVKYEMKFALEQAINDLYPKWETTVVSIVPERQYIRFDYIVRRREEAKKMTIAEIEKELGYKVEIISE